MHAQHKSWSSGQSSKTSKRPPSQKDGGGYPSLLSVQYSGGGSLPRVITPIARRTQECKPPSPPVTRARHQSSVPWETSTKLGAPDIKIRVPDACEALFRGHWYSGACQRENAKRALASMSSLEKEMATHSSILPWKMPWMEKPGRLQSTGSQRVGHNWATSLSFSLWTLERIIVSPYMHV